VSGAELVADRPELALLELADRDPAPAIRGADYRRVHQLEHRALAEGVRDDLGGPALFQEEPLEEIRRPDHLAVVAERKAEMGDTSVEVHNMRSMPKPPGHDGRLTSSRRDKRWLRRLRKC
jgi:hypothetical protein